MSSLLVFRITLWSRMNANFQIDEMIKTKSVDSDLKRMSRKIKKISDDYKEHMYFHKQPYRIRYNYII